MMDSLKSNTLTQPEEVKMEDIIKPKRTFKNILDDMSHIQGAKHQTSDGQHQETVKALRSVVEKLSKYPNEAKYRSLSLSNKQFQMKLLQVEKAVEFLTKCGF